MSFIPRAQEIYKHFKGNLYQIVTVAEHTETGEAMVVYQALYGEFKVYVRPLSMFCGKVDKEKYPKAEQEYRFELQQPSQRGSLAESENIPEPVEAHVESYDAQSIEVQDSMREEELKLDPMLLAFLDAETYAEKLNILSGMHYRITNDMITTMAIACDIEIEEGDLENRYNQLKNCLLTLDKYEITRLR